MSVLPFADIQEIAGSRLRELQKNLSCLFYYGTNKQILIQIIITK